MSFALSAVIVGIHVYCTYEVLSIFILSNVVYFFWFKYRHKKQAKIDYLYHFDLLTHLPNRLFFSKQIARRIQEKPHTVFAIIVFNVNNFKDINDSLGYAEGDALLRRFAFRLVQAVDEGTDLARLEGNTFVACVDKISNQIEANNYVRKMAQKILRPFALNNQEVVLTASAGICFYPENGRDACSLINNANTAMCHAKSKGRENCEFYSAELNTLALQRKFMEVNLRRALERNELAVYYQPKYEAKTLKLLGAEALLRWDHEGTIVPPDVFIPLAEETGLIVSIGQWVLRQALIAVQRWHAAGAGSLRVSVNVSVHQFRLSNFVESVQKMVNEVGVSPHYLDLELTESCIMTDPAKRVPTLMALNRMGATVSIDDFGTGYSSLSYLRELPIHAVKIDRSFIRNMHIHPKDRIMVRTIIAMAKNLQLRTIAEGVEMREQLAMLQEDGCDEVQGFYFSPAVPASEFDELLKRIV